MFTRPLPAGEQLLVVFGEEQPQLSSPFAALDWDVPDDLFARLSPAPRRARRGQTDLPVLLMPTGPCAAYKLQPARGTLELPASDCVFAQGIGLPTAWAPQAVALPELDAELFADGPLLRGGATPAITLRPDAGPWRALLDELRGGRSPHAVCQALVRQHGLERTSYVPNVAYEWAKAPDQASLEQLAHAFTWCTRVDRFAEGALDAFHRDGGVERLLLRGVELLGDGNFS